MQQVTCLQVEGDVLLAIATGLVRLVEHLGAAGKREWQQVIWACMEEDQLAWEKGTAWVHFGSKLARTSGLGSMVGHAGAGADGRIGRWACRRCLAARELRAA